MTIEEIDAEIEKVKEDNKGNFCWTFAIMDMERLHKMKEDLLKEMSLKEGQQPPQSESKP